LLLRRSQNCSMNCSRSSLVLNCKNAVRSSGEMMYTTSSCSHCLYWASSSLRARPIFFFCSLVSFCGAGGSLGSGACCACCAIDGGRETNMEKTVANRVRTTLAIGTPQPLKPKDSNARTSRRQTSSHPCQQTSQPKKKPNPSYFEALVPAGLDWAGTCRV